MTPGKTLGVVSQWVVIRARAPDHPHVDRLTQPPQLPVTMPGHLMLGEEY